MNNLRIAFLVASLAFSVLFGWERASASDVSEFFLVDGFPEFGEAEPIKDPRLSDYRFKISSFKGDFVFCAMIIVKDNLELTGGEKEAQVTFVLNRPDGTRRLDKHLNREQTQELLQRIEQSEIFSLPMYYQGPMTASQSFFVAEARTSDEKSLVLRPLDASVPAQYIYAFLASSASELLE